MADPASPTKFRGRNFVAVLYPEDPTHASAVDKLKTNGYSFAAILHDKDVYEDGEHQGELKKAHWHVVLKFKNAVWNTAIAKELGITPNYLEACKNLDDALLYLVHFGYENRKYEYNLEEVFGPLHTRLAYLLADDDESTRALNIYEMIAKKEGRVTYTEIFVEACKAGLYADFRRMGSGVTALINDHNTEWYGEHIPNNDYHRTKALNGFASEMVWKGLCNGKYDSDDHEPL